MTSTQTTLELHRRVHAGGRLNFLKLGYVTVSFDLYL